MKSNKQLFSEVVDQVRADIGNERTNVVVFVKRVLTDRYEFLVVDVCDMTTDGKYLTRMSIKLPFNFE